jgi:hypothetical protein
MAVTKPGLDWPLVATTAVLVFDDAQVAEWVISAVVLSL